MIKDKGFTMIELLVVVGIIIILMVALIIVMTPAERIAGARNNQRKAHINTIYAGLEELSLYNQGEVPTCLSEFIAVDVISCETELSPYIVNIPVDPICGNGNTGYEAKMDNVTKRIGVRAPCAEGEEIIAGDW